MLLGAKPAGPAPVLPLLLSQRQLPTLAGTERTAGSPEMAERTEQRCCGMPLLPEPARGDLQQGLKERRHHLLHQRRITERLRQHRREIEGQLAVAMGEGSSPWNQHQLERHR